MSNYNLQHRAELIYNLCYNIELTSSEIRERILTLLEITKEEPLLDIEKLFIPDN
jgi:hypothetical protein